MYGSARAMEQAHFCYQSNVKEKGAKRMEAYGFVGSVVTMVVFCENKKCFTHIPGF